jgi:hypothetical protein
MNARLRGLFRKHGLLIGAIALLSAGLVGAARLSQKVPTIATIDCHYGPFGGRGVTGRCYRQRRSAGQKR